MLRKKSEGKATESELRELESLAVLMRATESSVTITSEKDLRFLIWAKKTITTLESDPIKHTTDNPVDLDLTK